MLIHYQGKSNGKLMEDNSQRFEELHLEPGYGMQLAVDGYNNERGKTMLVGYLPKHSIIVTAPIIAGVPAVLVAGTGVTVRMFVPRIGSVCAFRSEVTHASRQPYPHLHLAMPKDVVIGEVRRSVRASVSLSGEIHVGDDVSVSHPVILNDLSVGGTSVQVHEPLVPIGETVHLKTRLVVEGISRELSLEAIVRTVEYHEKKKTVGLQFVNLSENDRITLYAYVMAHLYQ